MEEKPLLPQIQERCRHLLGVCVEDHSAPALLDMALGLDRMCYDARLEICKEGKYGIACLLLETMIHLQPVVFPGATWLLLNLVGKAGVLDLMRPHIKEGWLLDDCDCEVETCPKILLIKADFKESIQESEEGLMAVARFAADALLEAMVSVRTTPPPSIN